MNIPILRKTIRLANLATATVSIRAVLTLNERRVHTTTALRQFQRLGHLFLRAEHDSMVNVRHATVFSRLVNGCIDQVFRRHVKCSTRTTTQSRRRRNMSLTERFEDRLFVGLVFVTGDQTWNLVFQPFRRVLNQQFRILFRAFAVDHFQHKFVFGIKGNVIPIVTASGIRRIVFVAMFLFFPNEVPLLVELNLFRVRGTVLLKMGQQVRREVVRHVLRQVVCNDLRYRDQLSPNVLFFAFHSPRRRVREWKRRFSPAIASRKKPCRDVRKSVVYKSSNTTAACCLGRNRHERGYFLHPEHHVGSSFYSDNKTCQDRP